MQKSSLIGTWKLVRCEHLSSNRINHPWGEDALGQLMYTSSGFMSAFVSRRDRKNFVRMGLFEGTAGEKADAFDGSLAYCGRYRIEGNRVIHLLELSLFPNWVGTEQPRTFAVAGNRLTLTSDPFRTGEGGATTVATIVWERAD